MNYILQISISNDGSLFSPLVELTVYDSVCKSCESAANCIRQVSGLNRFSLLLKTKVFFLFSNEYYKIH